MRLTFQISYDDWCDVLGEHRTRSIKKIRRQRRWVYTTLRILSGVYAVAVVVIGLILAANGLRAGRARTYFMLHYQVMHNAPSTFSMLPWVGVIVMALLVTRVQRNPRRAGWIMLAGWIAWMLLGAVACWLAVPDLSTLKNTLSPNTTAWQMSGIRNTDLYAWIFMSAFWLMLAFVSATQARRMWNAQPNIGRAKIVDVDSDGLTIADESSRLRYEWPAIDSVVDTPHFVLVYFNSYHFHIILKRAFASDDELEQFWRLANQKGETAAKPFAVIPLARRVA